MEMELSNRKRSPRMNLWFVEPWTRDVFALGFVKLVELRRGLPRTGLGFCELVRITKCGAWV